MFYKLDENVKICIAGLFVGSLLFCTKENKHVNKEKINLGRIHQSSDEKSVRAEQLSLLELNVVMISTSLCEIFLFKYHGIIIFSDLKIIESENLVITLACENETKIITLNQNH